MGRRWSIGQQRARLRWEEIGIDSQEFTSAAVVALPEVILGCLSEHPAAREHTPLYNACLEPCPGHMPVVASITVLM